MNSKIDSSYKAWSLFLDRDGVINERIIDGYVCNWDDFRFLPGVPEALAVLSEWFGRIVIVTNQQGVGKGLMTEDELELIHKKMQEEVKRAGGRIDAIYYCPHLESVQSSCRKPAIDMGMAARRRFPEISFRKSLMVGDAPSDMVFAKRLGMKRVFVDNGDPNAQPGEAGCQCRVPSLNGLVQLLQAGNMPEQWSDDGA